MTVDNWYEDKIMPRPQKGDRENDSIRTSGAHQTRGTPSPRGRTDPLFRFALPGRPKHLVYFEASNRPMLVM